MAEIDKCECKWWKQLQQLKAENEELKENYIRIDSLLYECEADINNLRSELQEYLQCLDEIEKLQKELCRRCDLTFCGNTVCYEILQKVKEVKGNE